MRAFVLAAFALAGCNAVFGLDPVTGVDEVVDASPDAYTGPRGAVNAILRDFMQPSGQVLVSSVTAEFGPPPAVCTDVAVIGGCVAHHCEPLTPVPHPHAGTITVSSILAIASGPDAGGNYAEQAVSGQLFIPGASVTISASGGDVPAFADSIDAPSSVAFTSPMPTLSGVPPMFPRSVDLALTWTGGSRGLVQVDLGSSSGEQSIICAFPYATGTASIPAELLELLPPGSGAMLTYVTDGKEIVAGDYRVRLHATVLGKTPSGDWAAGPIELTQD